MRGQETREQGIFAQGDTQEQTMLEASMFFARINMIAPVTGAPVTAWRLWGCSRLKRGICRRNRQ